MTKTINEVMNDLKSSLKSYDLEGIEITEEDAIAAEEAYLKLVNEKKEE